VGVIQKPGTSAGWLSTALVNYDYNVNYGRTLLADSAIVVSQPANANFRTSKGRTVRRFVGTAADFDNIGANAFSDNDDVLIWLVLDPQAKGTLFAFGRGADGFGAGWSISIKLIDEVLDASCIVGALPFATPPIEIAVTGDFVFVAYILQQAVAVEPSHASLYCAGRVSRVGLTGVFGLRASTYGTGPGQFNGAFSASESAIANYGVSVLTGLTETQALNRVVAIESLVMARYKRTRIITPFGTVASTYTMSNATFVPGSITATGVQAQVDLTVA
jgi:hypothetical protein